MTWFITPRELRQLGIVGMNERNARMISRLNPRKQYPLVDDKLLTKELALKAGIAVPALYGVVETNHDVRRLPQIIADREDFVIKPAHGSGGKGILVITGRMGKRFRKVSGLLEDEEGLGHHVSNILSGMYSLGGQPDKAMIEYRVKFDPLFTNVSFQGVPDIRTVVYRGYPVMAMVRLPTRTSDGKANLHQGAVGAGIDITTGLTGHGVWHNDIIEHHPDTGAEISGIAIPGWDRLLELAAGCYELTGLGYLGVDVVLDHDRGPLILELNARPGLAIQIANGAGLNARIDLIEAGQPKKPLSPAERTAYVQALMDAERHGQSLS
ncbi:alpha-L-glutamate ligase-related protein [Desulfonatronum thiosulfatophilum]|uniref:Alpha-L-glutamate ligase-related protein n=1 Tax=Desulfonatronum thiosulfatophilum TaxID=617002 RepID=A0A1G6DJE4_9BACT|nr:alpha-L-glutamate ligase-like protein [Desulfonatronum thiosulfatophilum]SDB45221.1 alpha-L-glutamate ligase-related protein [Desulfonatronum thiosulfatophilum]